MSFLETPTVSRLPHRPSPEAGASPIFLPGQRVSERFRIVRLIGQGGMGQVFEADDLTLRHRVALKVIRPDLARTESTLEQFRQEVLLARQVTHPNVCRIFDVFSHEAANGQSPIMVLAMELLEGETLAEHLAREGCLEPRAARPLIRQMAQALAAAHKAGVIHLDFKSANVVLVPDDNGTRAVVTDFGLAASVESGEARSRPVGTPGYMAPELVEGKAPTPAADLYSFGVVCQEVLSGKRPVTEGARRTASPDLGRAWNEAIRHCLARRPEDRPESLSRWLDRLDRRGRRTRYAMIAAFPALVALALVALAPRQADRLGEQPAPAALARRTSVGVVAPANLSGETQLQWISAAVTEMLAMELSTSAGLRVVKGSHVAAAARDHAVRHAALTGDAAVLMSRSLAADYLIHGSYSAVGISEIRLELDLFRAGLGESEGSFAVSARPQELSRAVSELGARFRERLGLSEPPDTSTVVTSGLTSLEAQRLYAQGLGKLHDHDAPEALDLLARAVVLEPDHPLPRSALAQALDELGYSRRALVEARHAFELAGDLNQEDRLLIEARYRRAENDWEAAARLYGALWTFYPDEIDYGLGMARAQDAAGRFEEAFETLAEIRQLPTSLAMDPRVDLVEAEVALDRSDFQRALEAAEQAVTKAWGRGSRLLLADAHLCAGRAMSHLGRAPDAERAFVAARQLYENLGLAHGMANALFQQARLQSISGDRRQAQELYESALELCRGIGYRGLEVAIRNNYGILFLQARDLERAAEAFEESLAIARAIGDRIGAADALNNLAMVADHRGDPAIAEALYLDALETYDDIGRQLGKLGVINNLAIIYYERGEPARARGMWEGSLGILRARGLRKGEAITEQNIGLVFLEEGDLRNAEEGIARAMAITEQIEDFELLTGALLDQARVATEAARFEQAEALIERAAGTAAPRHDTYSLDRARGLRAAVAFHRGNFQAAERLARAIVEEVEDPDILFEGRCLLVRLLAARGEVAAAEKEAAILEPSGLTSTLTHAIALAEVHMAARRYPEAAGMLEDALGSSTAQPSHPLRLEARLLLGEAEGRLGRSRASFDLIESVVETARDRGLTRLLLRARRIG